jgi:hypothetical protein
VSYSLHSCVIFVQTYDRSYLYRLTWGHICTDLWRVIFVQNYEGSYLNRLMCHICTDLRGSYLHRLTSHICTDLRGVIFVQTYEGSYLYRLTCHNCKLTRGHICTDVREVIFAQTDVGSYLYRLTRCHICTDLLIIFVQTYVSYLYKLTCHIHSTVFYSEFYRHLWH